MGSVPTSLGEWIHSPWVDLGLVVWKGYRPRVRLVLAGGHASAWVSPFWRGPPKVPSDAIYQLFSTALGWRAFLPDRFANHKLLITRAIRLLTAATIRPAHARPPHSTWVTAICQIFRCYHPQGKLLFLRACFPQYVTVPVPDGIRMLTSSVSLRDRILGSQSMKCSMNLIASWVPPR